MNSFLVAAKKAVVTHWKTVVACVVGLVVAGAIAYVVIPAPKAYGGLKGHTVEIYRNASFMVIFNQPMDHKSAEAAFKISPPIAGSFSWKGNELAYKPAADLEKGATYEVFVEDTAKSLLRKPIQKAFRQSYIVLDYPEVSVAAPTDDSEIERSQVLTVLFDHPIRRLTGSLDVPPYLTISPPIDGKYNWLGTTGFEFIPKDGWAAATEYTVTIPKGTKTADGGSTVNDYTWKFRTAHLTVSLSERDQHNPEKPIVLGFNYPIKVDALKQALSIQEASSTVPNSQFSFSPMKDNDRAIEVMKNGKYKLGNSYTFKLPKGFTGGLGPLGLEFDLNAVVASDELGFRITAQRPVDQGTNEVYEGVTICFNNPLDKEKLKTAFRVIPDIKNFDVSPWGYIPNPNCDGDRAVTLGGDWKASTEYKVMINGSLADIYHQTLNKDVTFTFKTKPYRPTAGMSSYSATGVLASHLQRLYQVRSLNVNDTLTAKICSGTVQQFVTSGVYDCAELNASKIYPTQGTLNEYKIIDLDFDDIAGHKLPNGFYTLSADIPSLRIQDASHWPWQSREAVVVDTALTLKRDKANSLLVWATDLETGGVVPELNVSVYRSPQYGSGKDGELVGTGRTGADGTVLIKLGDSFPANASVTVVATNGQRLGVASSYWDDGIGVWNYGLETSYGQLKKHIGYLYTDRLIYRPDQKVYFKGVVREDVDARLSLPVVKEVTVRITDPEGSQLMEHVFPISSYGTFNGYFELKPEMKLGSYSISTEIPTEGHENSIVQGSFDVREYRRPDFKVELQTPEGTQIAGRPLKVNVNASYYYGSPLAGGKVYYEVTRNKLYFQPMRGEWYSYTNEDVYDCWWWCRPEGGFEPVKTGDGVIDDNGNFTIDLPKDLTDYKSSAVYNIAATVTDVSQRQVSANATMEVHRGEFYIGIRPDYGSGWNSPNADFELVTVNPDGSIHPGTGVTVKLYKRTWSSEYKEQTDGSSAWESTKKDELVDTKSVSTDSEAKGSVHFAPKGDGEFVAIAEAHDGLGNLIQASTNRYLWRGDSGTVAVTDDHQMKIVQTKASYEVGDTASLAVQTPYENTKALVTVERDTIREWRVIDLGTANRTVSIPIKDDATPNEYVSVLAVKGSKTAVPEFRLGYANLQVNTTKKVLDVRLKTDKEVYRPRDKVTLTLETKRSDGSPVAAEVSVAVVDERIISLLGSIDKNILGRFWFPRTIGVQTAQTLTMLVKKVFFATEGGGGKGGESGAPTVRGNFLDTAYWKSDVVTGADGKATVSFDLPDNLTSWQILAIGSSKDTVVGSAEVKIITRRDLMVEPILPRILRYQDTAQVGATVHNNTDTALTAQVSLDAKGVKLDGGASKSVSLAPRSRQLVTWTVRIPLEGTEASFTVTAKGGGLEDGFVQKLPILPYSVSETVSASGIFEKNVTETLEIPEQILKDQGDVTVAVQPNIGNGLAKGIAYLDTYPYDCSEQRTSKMLANLMAAELGKLQVSDMTDKEKEDGKARVNAAIATLVSTQYSDGGWSFWPEYKASAWLTAYVYYGLHQAEVAGFTVDQNAMLKADGYMRAVLAWKMQTDDWWWRQYWMNERAQVLFAMSERDPKGLKGYMDTLYEQRKELAIFGKIYLAMAYANVEKGTTSARSTTLLGDVKNKIVYLNPSTIYLKEDWDWGEMLSSDLRTSSLYLQALLRIDPKNLDIERVVRYIIQNRKDGYWQSTQATAVTLLGLVEYVRAHPIDRTAQDVRVFLNNDLAASLQFKDGDRSGEESKVFPIRQLLKDGDTHQVGLEKDSDKRWFYDVNMKVYRQATDIEPFENGFTVLSDYYDLKDKTYSTPLREIRQGENVNVRIKLLVPKRRRYVALEHHLPAGLEAVDFQLKTSPQYLQNQEQQCAPTWWGEQECFSTNSWNWGWWWENVWKHIELRDDRVFLFSENLEPGVYEYSFIATAVTPGEFRVPPARAYEFYNPLANAHNEGKIIKVLAP